MKASYTANNYMPYNNSPGIGLANQLAIASYLFEIIEPKTIILFSLHMCRTLCTLTYNFFSQHLRIYPYRTVKHLIKTQASATLIEQSHIKKIFLNNCESNRA